MEDALLLSLKLSLLTTLFLLFISFGIAYALAFLSFPGKGVVEVLVLLPIILPPTVLGFYLLSIFNRESPIGSLIETLFGKSLLFSFEGLLVASLVYSLPFGVFPIRDAFQSIHRRHIEIAYVFGYSKYETLMRVILPQSWGGILTACALVFAHTMGEFGVVLMVGGNIPGETQTLSIYIYDEVQSLNYLEAHRASLVLLLVSFISLSIVSFLRKRWTLS
ncbi:molybdate transport system permease protein [Hydrogenivirga caldilitoris]|uniref:Molybdenum transport system permease n=1 Tax=Hydrogenivirga caldilitoris TaxID=246264 RepID=A0A497XQ37_9AQUI|nr:molybdate ABC transporter permease subunit [Hydrogenivirga caldilitoris]RLJ70391.1 molybdate transport system permease protein [Hydrogenivirga caldilitoris]